jgi:hypothetical protein
LHTGWLQPDNEDHVAAIDPSSIINYYIGRSKEGKKNPVLGRYLVWRVRIASFGFNSGPTLPHWMPKISKTCPPQL